MASKASLTVYTKSASPAPLGAIALANYIPGNQISVSYEAESEDKAVAAVLKSDTGSCKTNEAIIKSIAQAFATDGLCGKDSSESAKVDHFITLAASKFVPAAKFQEIEAVADELEQHLTLRTYAVGYRLTAADFALWGAMKPNSAISGVLKKNQHPHLIRWNNFMESLEWTRRAVTDLKAGSTAIAKPKKGAANASFEKVVLEGAKMGHVVTRFPPEPSGYLHIGHAKAAILNQYFAKKYEGKMLIRFDDTNPSKEKAEFEQSIIEDLELLEIRGDKASYSSDHFDHLHQQCVKLIKLGKAYADDTLQEKMQKERFDGLESARRNESIEDNLTRFAEMTKGTEEGQRWCIRAKISVDDPNKALRDPVIYRVNLLPHHRTGSKWKVYPTYDFCCPVVDELEGVTHALRTNEYHDRNPQYYWMLESLGLRKVEIWDFARVNFVYTLLSKRKLVKLVDSGVVRGWDDPRFPTVRAVRRRGMTIEALRQFMLEQGPSQSVSNMEWDAFWALNKKVIDPVVPRHTSILKKDLVKVTLAKAPAQTESKSNPKHKKNPDLGSKTTVYGPTVYVEQEDAVSFGDNEEITLMDWGNAIIRKKVTSGTGIQSIEADLHLEGDFKKTKKKVTWLAPSDSLPLIEVTLFDHDYLINKKKLEEEDNFEDFLNPVTEFREEALADNNVKALKKGDIIQFERRGYFIVDKAWGQPSGLDKDGKEKVELIRIPDGTEATVSLKGPSKDTPPTVAGKVKKAVSNAVDAVATATGIKGAGPTPTAGSSKSTSTSSSGGNHQLPVHAPNEAQTTTLLSEGDAGFEVPVTTKMYKVEPVFGGGKIDARGDTKMYDSNPVY